MHGILRIMIALLVVGVPVIWLPTVAAGAMVQGDRVVSTALGPVADNDDPEDLCGSSNPRKQKKCRYNGWDNGDWNENGNDNDNNNNNNAAQATGPGGVSVELWRSTETPSPNSPIMLAVKGDGAPIERVSWWSTGPTADNPTGDDMAHFGEQGYDCVGARPCAWSWTVVPRHNGYYAVYAKVRDTAGNEVVTSWLFTAGQAPR